MLLPGCPLGLFHKKKSNSRLLLLQHYNIALQLSPSSCHHYPFMLGLAVSKVIFFCMTPHSRSPKMPFGQNNCTVLTERVELL